jgi:hypothetical protein
VTSPVRGQPLRLPAGLKYWYQKAASPAKKMLAEVAPTADNAEHNSVRWSSDAE